MASTAVAVAVAVAVVVVLATINIVNIVKVQRQAHQWVMLTTAAAITLIINIRIIMRHRTTPITPVNRMMLIGTALRHAAAHHRQHIQVHPSATAIITNMKDLKIELRMI